MNQKIDMLYQKMVEYYSGDPKRIQHFVKVHSFAKQIGHSERLDSDAMFVLEAAALVHDIGIKPSEMKYGSCNGKLQEQEGPSAAKEMLFSLAFPKKCIDRICFLVGHHHTYTDIDGIDYQVLVEADYLVNLYEDQCSQAGIKSAYQNIFRTDSGKLLCRMIYGIMKNDAEV